MGVTYEVKCSQCGVVLGSAEFVEELTDEQRFLKCELPYICEVCANPAPEPEE